MRASGRKLSMDSNNVFKTPSTLLNPIPSLLQADSAPMPSGSFVKVAIPLYYEGHMYRSGSRIRVTIAAPNGAQPVWSFGKTVPSGTANVSIAYSTTEPSTLVLPVVPGVPAPTPLPPCPSLRSQPCRPYVPIVNGTASQSHASAVEAPATVLGNTTRASQGSRLPATGIGDTAGFGIAALVMVLASRRWIRRAA
jgi:hypothetical protein